MKTNSVMLAITVGMFTFGGSAGAQEVLHSPRGLDNASRTLSQTTTSDRNLVKERPAGNARAWELADSLRTVPGTESQIDLAHAPKPLLSPKDPRYDSQLRWGQFQIAPVK